MAGLALLDPPVKQMHFFIWKPPADPWEGGGGTEAMASPKRGTRETKLCVGLP